MSVALKREPTARVVYIGRQPHVSFTFPSRLITEGPAPRVFAFEPNWKRVIPAWIAFWVKATGVKRFRILWRHPRQAAATRRRLRKRYGFHRSYRVPRTSYGLLRDADLVRLTHTESIAAALVASEGKRIEVVIEHKGHLIGIRRDGAYVL